MEPTIINHDLNTPSKALLSKNDKISILKNSIQELKLLCDQVDPFSEISDKQKSQLKNLGILDFSDPYRLTNQLIFITENAVEELLRLEKENA